jgi:hypothetical protein
VGPILLILIMIHFKTNTRQNGDRTTLCFLSNLTRNFTIALHFDETRRGWICHSYSYKNNHSSSVIGNIRFVVGMEQDHKGSEQNMPDKRTNTFRVSLEGIRLSWGGEGSQKEDSHRWSEEYSCISQLERSIFVS